MRECYCCGSIKTYVDKKRDNPHWYGNGIEGQWLCESCENKYIKNPKWHPITHIIYSPRQMQFKPLGRQIILKQDPRIGVCNFCRAVRGIDCKVTHMHHDEDRYDLEDPLRYTIELCVSCHSKKKK
jgi:hypothetical protein